MTEQELRNLVVKTAEKYMGCKESDGTHKPIIDLYNSHKPLARGYAVTYTDPWCATYVSAVAVECGLTAIIPTECSCDRMIALFKELGAWVESDSYSPKIGDIIFYDWDDSGKGDNTGSADHVGIVQSINAGDMTIIEGNISNKVGTRAIAVNGKHIRGFGVPDYGSVASPGGNATQTNEMKLPTLSKGSKGETVKAMQILLIGRGYSCGSYGADGDFGSATDSAVRKYQKANGLTVDGYCGPKTWAKLLGIINKG